MLMQADLGIHQEAYRTPEEGPEKRMLERMLKHKRLKLDDPKAELGIEEKKQALLIVDMDPEDQIDAVLEWSTSLDLEVQLETKEQVAKSTREKVELIALSEKHQLEAAKDYMTGAYNRRPFEEDILPKLMSRIERSRNARKSSIEKQDEMQVSLFFLDLDHFKKINDSLGHYFGDAAIKSMVKIVESMLRDYDTIVRWGGEEFIVMIEDISPENAYEKAESCRRGVENMLKTALLERCKTEEEREAVAQLDGTMSIGVVNHSTIDEEISGTELVRRADAAMYHSKNSGRNKVTVYDERLISMKEEKAAKKNLKA